jgi:hypothetical protein
MIFKENLTDGADIDNPRGVELSAGALFKFPAFGVAVLS